MLVRFVKIALALCGFMIAIEICARIDDKISFSAPLIPKYNSDSLRSYDKDGLPINVPNSRFEKWQHNRYGFRGPDFEEISPVGTTRIICLGASESYGLHESPGKEWPAQLQELLPSPQFQIVNASRAGLGFNSYERYVEKYILPLHPDKLVLVINPLFYFDNLEKSLSIKKSTTRSGPQSPGRSRIQTVIDNCRSLPKIKTTVKAAFAANFPNVFERYQVWNLMRQLKNYEATSLKGKQTLDQVPDEYVKHLHTDLKRLVSSISQHNIDVIVCTYPSLASHENIDRYPVQLLDLRRFFARYSLVGVAAAIDAFNTTVTTVASEMKIKLVEGNKSVPKTSEFFGDGVHYTDRGALFFATAVAKQVNPEYVAVDKSSVKGKVK